MSDAVETSTWQNRERGMRVDVSWRVIHISTPTRTGYAAEPEFGPLRDGAELVDGGLTFEAAAEAVNQLNEVQ